MWIYNAHALRQTQSFKVNLSICFFHLKYIYINFFRFMIFTTGWYQHNQSWREPKVWERRTQNENVTKKSFVLKLSSIQQLICSFLLFIFPGSEIFFFKISVLERNVCVSPDINRRNRRDLCFAQKLIHVSERFGSFPPVTSFHIVLLT